MLIFSSFETKVVIAETGINPLFKGFPKPDLKRMWFLFEGNLQGFRERF